MYSLLLLHAPPLDTHAQKKASLLGRLAVLSVFVAEEKSRSSLVKVKLMSSLTGHNMTSNQTRTSGHFIKQELNPLNLLQHASSVSMCQVI